ncbi:hypothetical protein CKO09_10620 [Chromatium weissei]|nr:hypothetical protein [Chromatium weissei]
MNESQRKVLLWTGITVAAMLAFPPCRYSESDYKRYQQSLTEPTTVEKDSAYYVKELERLNREYTFTITKYHFIFSRPPVSYIDIKTLLLQWFGTIAIGGILFIANKR